MILKPICTVTLVAAIEGCSGDGKKITTLLNRLNQKQGQNQKR